MSLPAAWSLATSARTTKAFSVPSWSARRLMAGMGISGVARGRRCAGNGTDFTPSRSSPVRSGPRDGKMRRAPSPALRSLPRLRARAAPRPRRPRDRGGRARRPHRAQRHRQVEPAQDHRRLGARPTTARCGSRPGPGSRSCRRSPRSRRGRRCSRRWREGLGRGDAAAGRLPRGGARARRAPRRQGGSGADGAAARAAGGARGRGRLDARAPHRGHAHAPRASRRTRPWRSSPAA